MTSQPPSPATTCPICGTPMQLWPRLDGPGWIAICPVCPPPAAAPAAPAEGPTEPARDPDPEAAGTRRFRDLIADPQPTSGADLPESLLEDLPEQARQLLAAKPPPRPTSPLREQLTDSLTRQGYVLSEDAHGVRITGAPRSGGTGGLSASDVVRMAADLDGGILPTEKRARCPKCDAVVPRDAARCEWCGQTLTPATT